jgi:hypothetical protein
LGDRTTGLGVSDRPSHFGVRTGFSRGDFAQRVPDSPLEFGSGEIQGNSMRRSVAGIADPIEDRADPGLSRLVVPLDARVGKVGQQDALDVGVVGAQLDGARPLRRDERRPVSCRAMSPRARTRGC